jgi:TP901 family phage tail tape measure protein
MAQNFTVNYDINVLSQDAVTAINSFTKATKQLEQAMRPFRKLNTSISNVQNNLTKLNAKTYTVKLETGKAVNNVDKLIGRIRKLKAEAKGAGINLGSITAGGGTTGGSRNTSGNRGAATGRTAASSSVIARNMPKNLGYKLLGPTPLDTGGIMAVDMLKGMGIAYGIAGIGSLISNSVKDYTEYNNIMQTAKNILGSHDKRSDFAQRFSAMEKQVRNVGVETKFTAPQVADAAKFLAMAGFDVDAINKSISPIADIALVGDTDLGTTADVVTNIMTGYNISPEKVRKAADIMTMTFTKSNTTLMEIAEAYKYSASLLSAGDVPFEEATAAMGVLGNAGIKGSQAGTTMRTIMANLVNPTKKQAAAWKRIGVNRTDNKGNMRDVVDIFEDLQKKDLSLSDYYQIFHKTAAQGAVSLADNVEVWNDIIKENFMSDGLAKELADAKKNTIQGLWAQLTSMFTEDGIEAFDEIQQPIKNFLQNITNWLTTDEAKNFIKQAAKDLMDFAKMIYDVSKQLLAFYERFRPIIKAFVEFQLKMWPILSLMRVFKAAFLGVSGIVKFSGQIFLLTGRIMALASAIKSVGVLSFSKNLVGGGFGLSQFWGTSYNVGRFGEKFAAASPKVQERYLRMYGGYAPIRNQNSPISGGAKAGGILLPAIGGVMGGFAGNEIGKAIGGEDSLLGTLGAGIGGIGMMAGLMAGGPVGWGVAGAIAVGGAIAYMVNLHNAANKAHEAITSCLGALTDENGMLSGDHYTITERYLNLVNNKELSINDIIKERIRLRNEELGFSTGDNKDTSNWDGKIYDEWAAKFNARDTWYDSGDMAKDAILAANQIGLNALKLTGVNHFNHPSGRAFYNAADDNYYWVDLQGYTNRLTNPSGSNDQKDVMAAMSALYLEGVSGAQGAKAIQQIQNSLYGAMMHGTREDFNKIRDDWQKNYGTITAAANTYPGVFSWGMDDLKTWSAADKVNTYAYQQGLFDRMNGLYGTNADIWKNVDAYFNAVDNKALTEDIVVKFISSVNAELGSWLAGYTQQTATDWAKGLGFDNGKWQTTTDAEAAKEKLESLIKVIQALGLPAQDAASNLLSLATQLNTFAGGAIFNANNGHPNYGAATNGAKETVNGVTYQYNASTGMWNPISGLGYSVMRPMDNSTMQGTIKNQKKNGDKGGGRNGRGGNNNSLTPGSHNTKASQADYKQHYNNNTAAPKQVIVKIENLMNVKSIDLTKKDNKEVIDNVKTQLTQALVDVVHDFDETWHG